MNDRDNAVDRPAWATCLDLENQSADHYEDYYNEPLLQMIEVEPRRRGQGGHPPLPGHLRAAGRYRLRHSRAAPR